MAEEVLVTVRIDKPKNQDELTRLTNQIIAEKNEVKQLETALKNLSKAEGDNSALIKATTKNLEIKKQQLSQNVASQKALVNVINAETKSLNALKAENAQLIRQRNTINTETQEGQKQIQAINARIDENNAKIKQNSSALEQQKINVGNYASALSGLNPAIGSFISGLQGMVTAAKAFIATPLGIVLAGIALLAGPVISFFKDTAVGADQAAREVEGFDYVLTRFKDKVNEFGKEIAQGEGSTNKLIQAQGNLIKLLAAPFIVPLQKAIDKYKEASEAGREYADAIDEINDSKSQFEAESALERNEIQKLILQAKDRTKTEQERIDLLDQVLQKEGTIATKRKTFAEDELSATLRLNKERLKSIGVIQEAGETQVDFALRAANAVRESTLSQGDALADQLLENIKNLASAENESLAILEKAQNKINELKDKQEEADKKRAEERKKQREKEQEAIEKEYEYQAELQKQGREKAEAERVEQNRIELEQAKTNADYVIEQGKRKRDNLIKFEEMVAQSKITLAQSVAGFLQAIGVKNKSLATLAIIVEKAASIAQIISNRGIANLKALALSPATFGQPFVTYNNLSAAFAIGSTVASAANAISQINSAQGFASGGIVGNKGINVTRSNGDNRLITAKDNEVVLTVAQRRRIGDDTLKAAGVPGFATGGIVGNQTRVAASIAESRLDTNRLAALVNDVKVVLVLEEYQAKLAEVTGIQNRATVI